MKPTPAQLIRAFNQVRRPDWPWRTVEELEAAKRAVDLAYTMTNACATSMANGHALAPVSVHIPAPKATPAPVQAPAPAQPHRRRDDPQGYSTALAASGEYARHDTE